MNARDLKKLKYGTRVDVVGVGEARYVGYCDDGGVVTFFVEDDSGNFDLRVQDVEFENDVSGANLDDELREVDHTEIIRVLDSKTRANRKKKTGSKLARVGKKLKNESAEVLWQSATERVVDGSAALTEGLIQKYLPDNAYAQLARAFIATPMGKQATAGVLGVIMLMFEDSIGDERVLKLGENMRKMGGKPIADRVMNTVAKPFFEMMNDAVKGLPAPKRSAAPELGDGSE